jgi:hypothetical protein
MLEISAPSEVPPARKKLPALNRCEIAEAGGSASVSVGGLPVFQQLLDSQAHVLCDLAPQDARNISSRMHWNRCAAAIGLSKLLMRSLCRVSPKPKA